MISISSTRFGRNHRPKRVELIEIINKPLLLLMFIGPYVIVITEG